MKKLITLAIFASILCGCSSSGNDTSTNSIVYDIEMTVKIGDVEKKYIDVYSYNNYELNQFSYATPVINNYGNKFYLNNGYLYGINNTGNLTGTIAELKLTLGQDLTNGQIITFAPSSADGGNKPFSFDFGGLNGYGYYFNNVNSSGQVKIISNQNNKLAGEFTFNSITVYSSTGTTDYATISGKFKNMPLE